jgi:hypothetical protein
MRRRAATIEGFYRVHKGLLAGNYPAEPNGWETQSRLRELIRSGVTSFLDLTEEGEKDLPPYEALLSQAALEGGQAIQYRRMPIPDFTAPTVRQMRDILDALDAALADGHIVYLHCYAGIGRTGTVVACYLVRHGREAESALAELARVRQGTALADVASPITKEQLRLVYDWAAFETSSRSEGADDGRARRDGRQMPPVGKLGGGTSRASVPRTEERPPAEERPSEKKGPRARKHPAAETRRLVDTHSLAEKRAGTEVRPHVEKRPRAADVPAGDMPKRAFVLPRGLGKTLKVVASVLGIAVVVALLGIALGVSVGRISLPTTAKVTATVDLKSDNLQGADLRRADLSGADMSGADLRGANAQYAKLTGAVLAGADLRYALLNEADLRDADLRGANLQAANLSGADLSGAQLEGANLKNVHLQDAYLPDGSAWTVSSDMRRFTDPTYHDFWRP